MKLKDMLINCLMFLVIAMSFIVVYWSSEDWTSYIYIINTVLSVFLFLIGVFNKLKSDSSPDYRWSIYTIIGALAAYESLIHLCKTLLPSR